MEEAAEVDDEEEGGAYYVGAETNAGLSDAERQRRLSCSKRKHSISFHI